MNNIYDTYDKVICSLKARGSARGGMSGQTRIQR